MSANEIVEKVLEQVHPGSIVLMHDRVHADAARLCLGSSTALRARGYRFVTASEMLGAAAAAVRGPACPSLEHRRLH